MSSLLQFYIYIDTCLYVKCSSVYNYVYCIVLCNIVFMSGVWFTMRIKFLPSITLFLIIIYYICYYLNKVVLKKVVVISTLP